MAIALL